MLLKLEDITNKHFREINGVYVHPDICLDSVVYKYIKKEYFYKMIYSQQLYVANRAQFSDRREKHWKENFKMRFLISPASPSEKDILFYKNLSEKINEAYTLCISCWTYDKHKDCDESITNWKCYGEDTYRIETTIEDLIWCIHPTDKIIILSPVSYEKSEYDGTVYNAIFKKYISYQDEQELRMCLLSSAKNELLNIDILKLIHKIRFKLAPTIVELSHLYEEKTK